jgi:nucleotide-binding universal stress UspA family protein
VDGNDRQRTMNAASGPVVLGVGTAVLGANRAGMEFAVTQARQRGVSVHLVHGCAPRHRLGPTDPWTESEELEHGRGVAGRAAQQLRRMSRHQVTIDVTVAPTSGVDALLAASATASVVVLQAHLRPNSQAAEPGSTIRTVAARADCPVVVLRGEPTETPKRGIVVGVEEHGRGQRALRAAMEQAARAELPVTAVYAWALKIGESSVYDYVPPSADELTSVAREAAELLMSEALAGLAEDFPTVDLRRRVVHGPVIDVLRQTAYDADLLVIGRHANSRLEFHALGHATRALLHDAPCPLMVIPPAGPFREPLTSRFLADVPIGTGY